jgi:polyisoprenoid-binding protein YceI
MKLALPFAFAAALPFLATPAPAATTYSKVDVNHSDVNFQIRHLISKVRGEFDAYSAVVVKDDGDPTKSSVEFAIDAASIDTGHEKRDADLRSGNFFDVANHPRIVFRSTRVEKVSDSEYRVTGDLTMRGATRSIVLPVTFAGEIPGRDGAKIAAFSTTTRLDRKEFGINWNRTLDNGGVLLGDDVDVTIDLEIATN